MLIMMIIWLFEFDVKMSMNVQCCLNISGNFDLFRVFFFRVFGLGLMMIIWELAFEFVVNFGLFFMHMMNNLGSRSTTMYVFFKKNIGEGINYK